MASFRTFSTALALSLLAGSALAAPVLRADVVVTTPIVTIGDMFDNAGTMAETAIFRAPEPGTSGTVDLAAILAAATQAGLEDFDLNGLDAIRVTRKAATVDETLLKGLIADNLKARGILGTSMHANARFSTSFAPIMVALGDAPAQLESLTYAPGHGQFSARFILSGVTRPLDITGQIEMTVDMPHLTANLSAGTVLMPDNIVMRPVPVQQADALGVANMDQLVGMALNRQSREGMVLRASDVSAPLTVAKNDLVTITYRRGPMTLTVRGQAITAASQGAPLQVLNLMSKRVITATAIAPGSVEVNAAPLAMAGL